jgi:hypothetical protein
MWLTLTDKTQTRKIAINFDRAIAMNPHHTGDGTDIVCGQGIGFMVTEQMEDIVANLRRLRT